MLQVRNLQVWYGQTEVLRDVSFGVPAGSIVALLGGNGSGKTTVLNALSGLLRPRGGEILVDGVGMAGWPTDRVVKAGVVQVPQGREVFSGMTVRENLELGAATRTGSAEIAADLDEMTRLFPALGERLSRRAGSLSGGEQQQVAIARALMARPKLLLMDEPSAGLSPTVVDTMIDTIRMLRDRGLTILLVEQNVGVAWAVAEHAHILRNGEIVHSAPASELLGDPGVVASYLG